MGLSTNSGSLANDHRYYELSKEMLEYCLDKKVIIFIELKSLVKEYHDYMILILENSRMIGIEYGPGGVDFSSSPWLRGVIKSSPVVIKKDVTVREVKEFADSFAKRKYNLVFNNCKKFVQELKQEFKAVYC